MMLFYKKHQKHLAHFIKKQKNIILSYLITNDSLISLRFSTLIRTDVRSTLPPVNTLTV